MNAFTTFPLPVYSYRVYVGEVAYAFSEVSGLTVKRETFTYSHGFSYKEGQRLQTYHYDHYVPLTLKRGVFPGAGHFYRWVSDGKARKLRIEMIAPDAAQYQADAEAAHAAGETFVPPDPVVAMQWEVAKAVVTQYEGPAFSAAGNEIAVDTIELQATGIKLNTNP